MKSQVDQAHHPPAERTTCTQLCLKSVISSQPRTESISPDSPALEMLQNVKLPHLLLVVAVTPGIKLRTQIHVGQTLPVRGSYKCSNALGTFQILKL